MITKKVILKKPVIKTIHDMCHASGHYSVCNCIDYEDDEYQVDINEYIKYENGVTSLDMSEFENNLPEKLLGIKKQYEEKEKELKEQLEERRLKKIEERNNVIKDSWYLSLLKKWRLIN